MTPEQITYVKNYIRDLNISLWAKCLYKLIPYRKKVIWGNFDIVFSDHISFKEKKKLAIAYYQHLIKCIIEFIQFRGMSDKKIGDRITIKGMEHILPMLKENKPMLFLTGHFGNWEVCLNSWPIKHPIVKNKLSIIRKKLNPAWLEKLMYQQCRKSGIVVLSNDRGLKKIITGFKKGISFLFVFDQYAHPTEGLLANFFGKPTGTYKMAAQLAVKYQLPIVCVSGYRDNNNHTVEIHSPLSWIKATTPEEEIRLNTQAFNHVIEEIILKHPDQWIWSHRRWKHHDGYNK